MDQEWVVKQKGSICLQDIITTLEEEELSCC